MPGTPAAVRLSVYGAFALLRSAGRINDNVNLRLWFLLNRATPRGEAFARWHDYAHTSHADVLALLASLTESEEP